ELLQVETERERGLTEEKERGLEQVREELETWRLELQSRREKVEEEVRERVAELTKEAEAAGGRPERSDLTDEAALKREVDLRQMEESVKMRERDLEAREKTMVLEIDRLEKERVEVEDLWNKLEGAKEGLSTIDEKTIEELERKKSQLDDTYLRLAEREEELRTDEKRLETEWERLHSIEEELAQLAQLLKTREDGLEKLE
ncbi:MAG: hypothetical protein LN411_01950, partial [Candidatus Thermoplasmatota archaeon]|nr:hypothetical protein [Candidatus Thermoplasmatota archaeon]